MQQFGRTRPNKFTSDVSVLVRALSTSAAIATGRSKPAIITQRKKVTTKSQSQLKAGPAPRQISEQKKNRKKWKKKPHKTQLKFYTFVI